MGLTPWDSPTVLEMKWTQIGVKNKKSLEFCHLDNTDKIGIASH